MESGKHRYLLWIISIMISISLIVLNYAGVMVFFEYFLVSALAIFCLQKVSSKKEQMFAGIFPLYILSVCCFLLMAILEYSSGYHTFLIEKFKGLLQPDFTPDFTHWFVVFVCFPVSFLLIGGYFLTKEKFLGLFFAWWGFFYFLIQACLHLNIELQASSSYFHYGYVGSFVAMALFLMSAFGIMRLIKEEKQMAKKSAPTLLTERQINLWSILFVSLVILYAMTLFEQAGILPVGVIAGSMMGGMIGWRKTTARQPADPYKLVPLYLLLQALFYIHVGEETLTHFNKAIAEISGHPWGDTGFNFLIALIGPLFWIFAAWSLWKRQAFGNFILWFMIVGMILGEPTHILVFPVVRMIKEGVGYQYFSGMYTALFPMIPAVLALTVILHDHRKNKILK